MKCARCDHLIPDNDRFCGRCGLAQAPDGKSIDPLIGVVVADRYRIEERIGVGGMGTVYLGSHTRVGQKVAIKVLHERHAGDAQLTLRFENEALTYGRVNHPNLVGLHDFGRTPEGMFFMVLEYCPGTPLSAVLRGRRALPAAVAVDIVVQIAQGLAAAHTAGFVHRDLKPENVVLMESRPGRFHAKLLDFGIAKSVDDDGPRLTQAGMVFGTPEYMSPEQARGEVVDHRSDVYALGCMLYELICGRPPFSGSNKMQVMHSQASEIPERPSVRAPEAAISEALETIILRCLMKRAQDRPQSAEALIDALDAAIGNDKLTPLPLPSSTSVSEATEQDSVSLGVGALSLPGRSESGMTAALMRASGLHRGPSAASLGVLALLFCGTIAGAAWLFSEPTRKDSPAEPVVAASVAVPVPLPPVASRPAPEPPPVAPAARTVAKAEVAAKPAPKAKKAPKPAPAPAVEVASKPAPTKPREPAAKAPPKPRKPDVSVELAAAKKALRAGDFTAARFKVSGILDDDPDHSEATRLRKRVNDAEQALALGRLAYDGADCVKTIETLERVLRVAPEAKDVSAMVTRCRDALPPTTL